MVAGPSPAPQSGAKVPIGFQLPVRRIPTRRNNVRRGQALRRTGRLYVVLTRTQAERELRRLVDATTVVAKGQRRTV
ncbi:MAG: hypothetical protein QOD81_2442, partial [Solirubrobacteraceae bacterium]|nr:hypothetical protein [Solirubrobacteraceae bacterium]